MGIMLSAKGITERSLTSKVDDQPFDLPDDIPTGLHIECDAGDLPQANNGYGMFAFMRQWAEMQRDSYAILAKAFAGNPGVLPVAVPVVQAQESPAVTACKFPPDLLSRPMENILVSDERLGLPGGCISVLESAGIVSVAGLRDRMNDGGLTKIPRVGKAKAAVIGETLRAFIAAVKAHETEQGESNE